MAPAEGCVRHPLLQLDEVGGMTRTVRRVPIPGTASGLSATPHSTSTATGQAVAALGLGN
jgi:hypothetical protein